MSEQNPRNDDFKKAVRIISSQREQLRHADAPQSIIDALEKIVSHLNRLPPHAVNRLIGNAGQKSPKQERLEQQIERAKSLSIKEVERIIERSEISRLELEAIAIGRFEVPKGSMRSFTNIDLLREKLQTFVQNEKSHIAISRLAKDV